MIKAVLYDVDGMVLTGTRFSDKYASEFGISVEEMSPFFGEPFNKCVLGQADLKETLVVGGWLGRWKWQGTVDELLEYWFKCGDTKSEQVLTSVASLRSKDIVCVLTTNQEKYRTAFLRDTLKLPQYFDTMFASVEIGYKKPDPRFFEAVMTYLTTKIPDIQRNEILFWDDRETYAAGARKFGFEARIFGEYGDYQTTMNGLISS